ncbi:MAG: acetyl-CoA carboxylase, carboxyltransferase subunit beta [Firmicutes bacterium]|jgi:acetyl-CoA carboxylase carboxyl transferase subunit beta|nr:acetyl-CoA carboxylase, carboxyltransferase subunit beta [Bacillota bacterium]
MIKDIFRKKKSVKIPVIKKKESSSKDNGKKPFKFDTDKYSKCKGCESMLISGEFKNNMYVCPKCGFHSVVDGRKRIGMVIDKGTFTEYDKDAKSIDILNFPGYEKKLKTSIDKSGEVEAVITGQGKIHGIDTIICVMNPKFMMGSMGSVVGEKIALAIEKATEKKIPVLIFCASGGARMQEGIVSLMQMGKTSAALKRHSDAGLLYLPILTNPTTGGVTASFAMLGDMIIAEPGALIGFAGPRVIEQTIRQKLPEGFQRSEFLVEKGFVDKIVDRRELKEFLYRILGIHKVD